MTMLHGCAKIVKVSVLQQPTKGAITRTITNVSVPVWCPIVVRVTILNTKDAPLSIPLGCEGVANLRTIVNMDSVLDAEAASDFGMAIGFTCGPARPTLSNFQGHR